MGRKGDLMTIMNLIGQGKLNPVIDRVLPLTEVRQAHQIIEEGKHFGKIVMVPL
jgi:alcohol dehydrogenase